MGAPAAAGALMNTFAPDPSDYDSPAGRAAHHEEMYGDHRERELEERRLQGERQAESERRRRMIPGVHATPDPRRAARALLRRP
ncbi:hypothetical protein [Solirubrobacter deserti]|uniref:Uncharacterized protein n=1 Tax=Solirubrobacter deserti TaxID=2282478 RepID=A0ABT4RTY2_9ACTN|nr:hypothetical protein [Solirubrobacter deserti]MDA0141947.1 hypothetical protein [Solirubrobacter deserti]